MLCFSQILHLHTTQASATDYAARERTWLCCATWQMSGSVVRNSSDLRFGLKLLEASYTHLTAASVDAKESWPLQDKKNKPLSI